MFSKKNDSPKKRTLLGHPAGLFVLFSTEMWERFSFYGMRALLVLYLVSHVGLTRENALEVYALYTGLVYLTPLIGGWLTDRFLGQRKGILIGGLVMALGHFAMAFEPLLYPALGLLVVGNGFFKPNISTLVGSLYEEGDSRKDGAYTIFYMGINLGAFFAPIVCGYLGESEAYGWHYGFGAAGIGMVIGLLCFLMFQRTLGSAGFPPNRSDARSLTLRDWRDVLLYTLGSCGVVWGTLWSYPAITWIWNAANFVAIDPTTLLFYRIALILVPLGGIWFLFKRRSKGSADSEGFTFDEWKRIGVILVLTAFAALFWMGFEQAGGTMTLFAAEQTELSFFGWDLKATYFQAINPLLIFCLAPLFSLLWTWMERRRYHLSSIAKMGIGLILAGLGFVVMYAASQEALAGRVSPLWLVAVYALHTLGELCLSPVGLSTVNKLAPVKVASLMMAVWLLSSAVANYLAGTLESILANASTTWGTEINLWLFLTATSIGAGVLLLFLSPFLKRMTQGRD